eukprot:2021601-Prymnesium_polylepis.2
MGWITVTRAKARGRKREIATSWSPRAGPRLVQPRSTAGCTNPSATSCRRRVQQQQVHSSSAQRRRGSTSLRPAS